MCTCYWSSQRNCNDSQQQIYVSQTWRPSLTSVTLDPNNKIEKVEEKCLLAVLIDYSSNYSELLQSSEFVSMEAQRLRAVAYEV